MPAPPSSANGARVLADLNALRAIGAYETGVHKPTFSAPHLASLQWLLAKAARGRADRGDRRHRQCADDEAQRRDRSCWPARISKARITPAGSTGRSASSMRWKRRACSTTIPTSMARSRSRPGATRKAISAASSAAAPMSASVTEADIDAARDRTSGRTMREALSAAGLAGVARRTAEPGRHIGYLEAHIEQGDSWRAKASRSASSPRIVGIWQYRISFTGEQNHAGTTRMADPQGCGAGAGEILRRDRRALPGNLRAAHGMDHRPHHARSRRRPASSPAARRCCSRSATPTLPWWRGWKPPLDAMADEVNAQGRCGVTVDCLRKGAPAMMDAKFQDGDRGRKPGLCRRQIGADAERRRS